VHATYPYPEPDQSIPIPFHFLNIQLNINNPSTHGSSKFVSFSQVSPPKPCIHLSFPPTRVTCPAYLILLDSITRIISGVECRLLRPSLYSFLQSPVTPSLLGQNILINTLLSKTLSLRISLLNTGTLLLMNLMVVHVVHKILSFKNSNSLYYIHKARHSIISGCTLIQMAGLFYVPLTAILMLVCCLYYANISSTRVKILIDFSGQISYVFHAYLCIFTENPSQRVRYFHPIVVWKPRITKILIKTFLQSPVFFHFFGLSVPLSILFSKTSK